MSADRFYAEIKVTRDFFDRNAANQHREDLRLAFGKLSMRARLFFALHDANKFLGKLTTKVYFPLPTRATAFASSLGVHSFIT